MKRWRKEPFTEKPYVHWLDNLLLCVVLGLTVLRLTIIEVPHIDAPQTETILSSEAVSLLLSTGILFCAFLWFVAVVCTGRLNWRRTWFGIGVGVFVIAGIIAALFASDKRAAVTDLVTLATPMIGGMMLVQWLKSISAIRWALLLILAVGAAAVVQCSDQYKQTNEMLVAEYEADPDEHLKKLGLEPDSMEHWMYEHRLYSKDIRGFLMTSNSSATFFLMAFFASIGLILQTISKKMSQHQLTLLICYFLAGTLVLGGLFLTQSKGGIGAFLLSSMLLIVLLAFGKTLWKHRFVFGVLLLLLIVVGAGLITHYGLLHGRLPGGNSMLVRWQYWVSTVDMIRDHTITGVGGGNFSEFYFHYKIPAASETIQNPHNWVLSLLSQYGLLGLLAFTGAVVVVFFQSLKHCFSKEHEKKLDSVNIKDHLWVGLLAVSAVMLLFVRPGLDADFLYYSQDARATGYLILYLMPAVIVVAVFLVLRAASSVDTEYSGCRLSIALLCGLVAVLIHNLIDFAIFEPGNWSLFWMLAAILIAHIHNADKKQQKVILLNTSKRLGLFAVLVLVSVGYLSVVLLPPLRADTLLKQSMTDGLKRDQLLQKAVEADSLSGQKAYRIAGMLTQIYMRYRIKDESFLEKATAFAAIAAERNPESFKPRRLLARINVLLAEQADKEKKEQYLQVAFDHFQQAVNRYPGSDKLHYDLAVAAEQLGLDAVALCHYQAAVEIEDAYRAQFRIMYPEHPTTISRLGESAYNVARAKIEQLQNLSVE